MEKLIRWLEKNQPIAYADAVTGEVFPAQERKKWLSIEDDKEYLNFHKAHRYDTPLKAMKPFESL